MVKARTVSKSVRKKEKEKREKEGEGRQGHSFDGGSSVLSPLGGCDQSAEAQR